MLTVTNPIQTRHRASTSTTFRVRVMLP